jgi:hypothetical protein
MSEKVVVGVCGYARAGKDTVASVLVEQHGFVRRGFADALRDDLLILNPLVGPYRHLVELVDERGWDAAKQEVPEVRRLMQVYGTDVRRSDDDSTWIRRLYAWVDACPHDRVVVPDVRFPNEVQGLTALVRVTRPDVGPVNEHVSDNLVGTLPYTHLVSNDGTVDDLYTKVTDVLARLLG